MTLKKKEYKKFIFIHGVFLKNGSLLLILGFYKPCHHVVGRDGSWHDL